MNIQPLLQNFTVDTFLNSYLEQCGISNPEAYLQADLSCCDSPMDYPNMQRGIDRLRQAFENDERIGLLVDADCDGFCAAAIFYQFMRMVNPLQIITPIFHLNKSHGITQNKDEDVVAFCAEYHIDLLVCPDAASSNFKQHWELGQMGIDCLVLDHHEVTMEDTPAIIINHHLGEHLNTFLSGAGVTFKFCQACAKQWNVRLGDLFYDLVATSIVTDVCDMRSNENYALVKYGLTHLTNNFLKQSFEKFNTKGVTPIGIAWGFGPRINAVTRKHGTFDDKVVFDALINEGNIEEALQVCKEAHQQQSNIVNKITKDIEPNLEQEHNVCVGFSDAENRSYLGLIANKITGKYGKPTMVLRQLNRAMYSGSLRSPIDIADKINATGLAECHGHLTACGISLNKNALMPLIQWFDSQDLDTHPVKQVCAIIKPKDITLPLCNLIQENMLLWSSSEAGGVPLPQFYMEFNSAPDKYQLFIKRTKTIKFNINECDVLKFMAKQEDVDKLQRECKIKAIVELSLNEWAGNYSPQAKIVDWEISDNVEWEDLF